MIEHIRKSDKLPDVAAGKFAITFETNEVAEIVQVSHDRTQAFVRVWRGPGSAHGQWVPCRRFAAVGTRDEVVARLRTRATRGGLDR